VALYATESSAVPLIPVDKLVLVDAAGLKQDKPIPFAELNPSTLEDFRALMKDVFYDTSWLTEETLRRRFADKLATRDGYTVHSILSSPDLASEMLDGRLAQIQIPTLVVWGKQDTLLPPSLGERYAAGIPGARLVSFDKCGHVPPLEEPAEFVSAVSAFLDSAPVH
jgi:pimeloyl-ACP methyl ester carboxylesterase